MRSYTIEKTPCGLIYFTLEGREPPSSEFLEGADALHDSRYWKGYGSRGYGDYHPNGYDDLYDETCVVDTFAFVFHPILEDSVRALYERTYGRANLAVAEACALRYQLKSVEKSINSSREIESSEEVRSLRQKIAVLDEEVRNLMKGSGSYSFLNYRCG